MELFRSVLGEPRRHRGGGVVLLGLGDKEDVEIEIERRFDEEAGKIIELFELPREARGFLVKTSSRIMFCLTQNINDYEEGFVIKWIIDDIEGTQFSLTALAENSILVMPGKVLLFDPKLFSAHRLIKEIQGMREERTFFHRRKEEKVKSTSTGSKRREATETKISGEAPEGWKTTPRTPHVVIQNETPGIGSLIESKLRKLIHEKPTREKDVLDALENLFIGAGLDKEFTREQEQIPYSVKGYVPDFVFNRISTIVEAKLCDIKKREKEIIAEINDDIIAYETRYSNLIFVVYDLGFIRDVERFKGNFEQHGAVLVKVIKH